MNANVGICIEVYTVYKVQLVKKLLGTFTHFYTIYTFTLIKGGTDMN